MDEGRPTRIVLGGDLAHEFAPEYLFYGVVTVADAIRAIDANVKGRLRRYLTKQGYGAYYKIALGNEDNALEKNELTIPNGGETIYILPAVKGAKSGWAKIIAAVVIAVVTVMTAGTGGPWAMALYQLAASLAIQGVMQLITPIPNFDSSGNNGIDTRSNIFQGNATAIAQGIAVPLVYGRMRVPALPISTSLSAIDQSTSNSFAVQTYTINYGAGGVISYDAVPVDPNDNLPPDDENQP